jgi:hypothetical protein
VHLGAVGSNPTSSARNDDEEDLMERLMRRVLTAVLAATVVFISAPYTGAASVCFGSFTNCPGSGGSGGSGRGFGEADAPPPTISIRNDSSPEGDFNEGDDIRRLRFRVVLSDASDEVVSVRFATSPDTADSGVDYDDRSGRISFGPGVTLRKVVVVIVGDFDIEPDETLFVRLSNPVNGQLGDRRGRGTILDDDDLQP